MTYGHLQADCLYTGISSGPNARYEYGKPLPFLPSAGQTTSAGQSVGMLCGWGVKAGWLVSYVDKRVGGR